MRQTSFCLPPALLLRLYLTGLSKVLDSYTTVKSMKTFWLNLAQKCAGQMSVCGKGGSVTALEPSPKTRASLRGKIALALLRPDAML